MGLYEQIRDIAKSNGYSINKLEQELGFARSSINKFNKNKPSGEKLQQIADFLKVSVDYLMTGKEPNSNTQLDSEGFNSKDGYIKTTYPSNLIPLTKNSMKKVPLVGTIACGTPILAEQNVSEYIDMDNDIHADFALRCKGDSMINARIFDGDIVYIKIATQVENGEIAAVLIEDIVSEATLKRFYKDDEKIRLCAENPTYKDMVFYHEEINAVRVLGKAVAFLSAVK